MAQALLGFGIQAGHSGRIGTLLTAACLLLLLMVGGCAQGGSEPAPPLAAAVIARDAARVKQLVDAGEDANGLWMGRPLLEWALADGQNAIAQTLFEGGARVDAEVDGLGMVDAFYRDGESNAGAWLEAHGAHRKP